MITKFKIFEFINMEKMEDLLKRQQVLYARLQNCKNKQESESIEDEILINSRVIEEMKKRNK